MTDTSRETGIVPSIQKALERRAAVLVLRICYRYAYTPAEAAAEIRAKRAETRPELLPIMSRAYSALRLMVATDYYGAQAHLCEAYGLRA